MNVLPNLAMRMTVDCILEKQLTVTQHLPFGIITRESGRFCSSGESLQTYSSLNGPLSASVHPEIENTS